MLLLFDQLEETGFGREQAVSRAIRLCFPGGGGMRIWFGELNVLHLNCISTFEPLLFFDNCVRWLRIM